MPKPIWFDDKDAELIQQALDILRRRNNNTVGRYAPEHFDHLPPEVYPITVSSGGIPARSGTTVSGALCDIYKLNTTSESTGSIINVEGFEKRVFNATDTSIAGGTVALARRDKWGTWWIDAVGTGGGGSFNLTVEEVDLSPSLTSINTFRFDQADGFVVSQPSAGIARVDLLPATATQAGIVSIAVQQFAGDKDFVGNVTGNSFASDTFVSVPFQPLVLIDDVMNPSSPGSRYVFAGGGFLFGGLTTGDNLVIQACQISNISPGSATLAWTLELPGNFDDRGVFTLWYVGTDNETDPTVFARYGVGNPHQRKLGASGTLGDGSEVEGGIVVQIGAGTGTGSGTGTGTSSSNLALRGYIDGLILSYVGTSTFGITAGCATDTSHTVLLELPTAFTKLTNSLFSEGSGNGAIDAGSFTASTWYHVFIIGKADFTADILVSTSPTSPTMPSGFVYKRRIGVIFSNGSSQILQFSQEGDVFLLNTPTQDVSAVNPGVAAVLRTLSVPTGIKVVPLTYWTCQNASNNFSAIVTSPDQADTVPSATARILPVFSTAVYYLATFVWAWTNTSAQLRTRISVSGVSDYIEGNTFGWVDPRGRDMP